MTAINPYSEQAISSPDLMSDAELEQAVQQAEQASQAMAALSFAERAPLLQALAQALRQHRQPLAELMATEMGKPLTEGLGEVEKAAWCAEHYAEHAAQYLAPMHLASDASSSYVQYQPLGVILGIMPWNAPVWLVLRFAAPGLMAGNACLLKHDPHVPGTAQLLGEIFASVDAPKHWLQFIRADHRQVAELIARPEIKGLTLTGSDRAGSAVAAQAGQHLKPVVLELGGSDAALVLEGADLTKAAKVIALSRSINAGQSCIAAKRIIVERSVYPDFVALLQQELAAFTLGDPLLASTKMGPLARADLRQQLNAQVEQSVAMGAQLLMGGQIPEGKGFFYPPTLLTQVTNDMPCARQETFGPVAAVLQAEDAEHALALANDSQYGLAAAIWGPVEQCLALAGRMQTGQVAINGIVKTDPRLPSGGIKRSGMGRELGPQGILALVNAQQIWQA